MKPPIMPSDEYEEIVFVRNVCADLIRSVDEYFKGRYPNGLPFLPDEEDRNMLNTIKGFVRRRIFENRAKFPVWNDDDVEALTEIVFMHMNMRFKRIERNISKLPEYPLLVQAIVSAENEPQKPEIPANVVHLPKRSHLRLVKTAPKVDGE